MSAENQSSTHAAPDSDSSPFFRLEPGVAVWTIVAFGLLLVLLKRFVWGPLIAAVDEREKNIRDSLDMARQAQNESKRIAQEQNEILAQAKTEAAQIVQRSRQAAEDVSAKVKAEAQQEKDRILVSARREIETAKTAAVASLRRETAELAVDISEKLLGETLDADKRRRFVDKEIDNLSFKA